jgi:hypothetical protein
MWRGRRDLRRREEHIDAVVGERARAKRGREDGISCSVFLL